MKRDLIGNTKLGSNRFTCFQSRVLSTPNFLKKMSQIDKDVLSIFKTTLICALILYVGTVMFFIYAKYPSSQNFRSLKFTISPSNDSQSNVTQITNNDATNISHLLFKLVGSEKAWHHRKPYIESWWRPNITKGYLFLDVPPQGDDLIPWSKNSPPYRISHDVPKLVNETKHVDPRVLRIVHAIMEVLREEHEGIRWLITGDDDSIFFVDNMVDVLAQYNHNKYYYIGGQSESIMANYRFSFHQAFGGGGIIMSYPLAKAMANTIMSCLKRYRHLNSSDITTVFCTADLGVNLSPLQGIHQIDLRGDLSGFLSSQPKSLLMSLHHFDFVEPIFPSMDRAQSGYHLLNAAKYDQSRMLQQTICHKRSNNWTFSISWGYSAHIYENIMPRSLLQNPIETFTPWYINSEPPHHMFDVRKPTLDPCEAPHVFFFKSIEKISKNVIRTTYTRGWPRLIGTCLNTGNYSAEYIFKIHVYSSATKRIEIDRCECCDIIHQAGSNKAKVKYRECKPGETIA